MKPRISTKKGFTLAELLIAMAVLAIFLTGIATFLVDMYRTSKRITLEEQLYQDLRIMMNQMTQMVEENAIDYEEYYREAASGSYFAKDNGIPPVYTYGDYSKKFYDFGAGPGANGEGAFCSNGDDASLNPGCVINKTTLDRDMGQNPSLGDADEASAFCGPDTLIGNCSLLTADQLNALHKQNNLYLINKEGTKKTILATEEVEKDIDGTIYTENALSIAWLYGTDTDSDDVVEDWNIGFEFVGTGGALPATDQNLVDDLASPSTPATVFENFIPISPLRTNIVDLKFYVNPLEDPYKAFSETFSQPSVTIVMTVKPSVTLLENYLGPVPQKTLQTTVYSGVRENVRSY